MPRVKISITEVHNAKDIASGFDAPRLQDAAEQAITWLVQKAGVPPTVLPVAPVVVANTITTESGTVMPIEDLVAKKAQMVARMAKARAARTAKREKVVAEARA